MKTFSFQIVLADLPRDKEDKPEYQREVLSDLQRIAEDLVAEITNHRVLFGDLITVQNVTLEPFLEEFHHTLTGWTISLDLLVPYYWDACSIPAEWNDFFESGSGGTGSILTFIDSITRDENGNVSLVNDEAIPAPNYYYGTNDEGVRGWYLTTDNIGLTCETIGDCQTIIDIEAAIDALEEEIVLKADITSISAVGFSNDYNDLSNLPTIPTATSDLTNDSGFITIGDVPAQVNADWNSVSGVSEILNKPTIPTSLPPSGAAGGDLTGTYPNPTVHRVHGVDFQSGSPAVDDTWIYVSTPFGTQPFQWQHSKLKTSQVQNDSTVTGTNADDALEHLDSTKQATLVSGTNIKTVNSNSLLGAGNVSVGTVTSVSALTLGTTGTDLSSTVATGTTTPVITLNVPTASAANRGALSAADWTTFNGKQAALVSGTNIKTINSTSLLGSGNVAVEPTITAGTTGQYYRGDKTFQTLDKTAVGLANVDNTSDANKPVSTATQTALNLKQNTVTLTTTGNTGAATLVGSTLNIPNYTLAPSQGIYLFDDFLGSMAGSISTSYTDIITYTVSGGAAQTALTITNRTNQQGVISMRTNAIATSAAGYGLGNLSLFLGGGAITIENYICIPTLSTLTDRFFSQFGYVNSNNMTNPLNGVFFSYDEGGQQFFSGDTTPNFKCYSKIAAGTRTLTTTSIPVVAGQWYKLRLEINAALNQALFYIDNVLVATHTTNIPASNAAMTLYCAIQKVLGLNSRTIESDYLMYKEIFTNPR
jgi:hypothetical protein